MPTVHDLGFTDRFELRTTSDDDSPFTVPPFWIRSRDRIEDSGRVPVARPRDASGVLVASTTQEALWRF